MRVLVVGAGALGGYFGAHLLAADQDVTFLVRPARAAQLAADGLHVLSPNGDLHLPPPRTVLAGELRPAYDVLLLTPKSYDLVATIEDVKPAAGPGTLVLPLLNGMAHLAELDRHFSPANVLGGLSNISATRDANGTIRHLSRLDRFYFGARSPETPDLRELATVLGTGGFHAELRTNIVQDMWDKWATIATGAGATCLLRGTIGQIVAGGGVAVVTGILDEASAVAAAEGHGIAPAMRDEILGKFTAAGSPFTASMLRDLEAGAPVEREQVFGDLLRLAGERGIETPLLRMVDLSLRVYEERRSSLAPARASL